MDKFWHISTELWPLIDVLNWFSLYLWHSFTDFFKLGMRVNIVEECSGIADG